MICFQVPQYLHEAGWSANGFTVGVTQPRRVAATTVSTVHPHVLEFFFFSISSFIYFYACRLHREWRKKGELC